MTQNMVYRSWICFLAFYKGQQVKLVHTVFKYFEYLLNFVILFQQLLKDGGWNAHYDCGFFYFGLKFYQSLLYVFWCSAIRFINA